MANRRGAMENLDLTFWHKKRVLVTGHTGFKGSWLSLWLQSLGATVIGFALPPTHNNLFQLANVANGMINVFGDIRNYAEIFSTIKKHSPEIVIHLAAQSLVIPSYDNPIETYATNVMGTVHLLEAIRQSSNTKVIINVTTDKCYENNEWHWGYRENDRLGGRDPYSNSKSCSELVTVAYRNSYFNSSNTVSLASARAGNVIGGGDWSPNRLIPDIIRAHLDQRPALIRNPNAVRPWQHVLEPLYGYLLLAKQLYNNPTEYAESWNFGPNEEDMQSVRWITEYIGKFFSSNHSWQLDQSNYPHETTYLRLDCSKAKAKLGWQPRWCLTKGLEKTMEWYQSYHAQRNMYDITLAQINSFI